MKKLSRAEFAARFKEMKLLALDVDGVLTDDSIYFGPDGLEFKRFNISDGFYMVIAMRAGLELAVVSGRFSAATETRMKDLGVKHVLQDRKDKIEQITPLLKKLGIDFSEVAFIGNELLDIKLARKVGLPIAVADAVQELQDIASYVTEKKGGAGAVREILECYFEGSDKDPKNYII
jgi:3-deoxy-D-manno-octulosonate 8-phosphate phosphatase (KDO 8-P phosphatase)